MKILLDFGSGVRFLGSLRDLEPERDRRPPRPRLRLRERLEERDPLFDLLCPFFLESPFAAGAESPFFDDSSSPGGAGSTAKRSFLGGGGVGSFVPGGGGSEEAALSPDFPPSFSLVEALSLDFLLSLLLALGAPSFSRDLRSRLDRPLPRLESFAFLFPLDLSFLLPFTSFFLSLDRDRDDPEDDPEEDEPDDPEDEDREDPEEDDPDADLLRLESLPPLSLDLPRPPPRSRSRFAGDRDRLRSRSLSRPPAGDLRLPPPLRAGDPLESLRPPIL